MRAWTSRGRRRSTHWLPRRIEARVKICVLALLIQRVAEVTCKQSWARIHDSLVELQATLPDPRNPIRKVARGVAGNEHHGYNS